MAPETRDTRQLLRLPGRIVGALEIAGCGTFEIDQCQMAVTGVRTVPGTSRADLLRYAGSVEHASEHAVAAAITALAVTESAPERGLRLLSYRPAAVVRDRRPVRRRPSCRSPAR